MVRVSALSARPLINSQTKARLTLASSNVSLNVFSDSPDMPETIEGAETLMNGKPSSCAIIQLVPLRKLSARLTPAKHLTSCVFPPPGTPCSNTPLGLGTPVCWYISGCNNGKTTISINWVICDSRPPRLDNLRSGGAYLAASCSGSCRGRLRRAVAVGVGGRSSVGVGMVELLAVGCGWSDGPGLDEVEELSGMVRFVRFFGAAAGAEVAQAAVMD